MQRRAVVGTRRAGRSAPIHEGFYEFEPEEGRAQVTLRFCTAYSNAVTAHKISAAKFVIWAQQQSAAGILAPFPEDLTAGMVENIRSRRSMARTHIAFLESAIPVFKPEDVLCEQGKILLSKRLEEFTLADHLHFIMETKHLDFGDLVRGAQEILRKEADLKIPEDFNTRDMSKWFSNRRNPTATQAAYDLAIRVAHELPAKVKSTMKLAATRTPG